jgi:hypothetical protein
VAWFLDAQTLGLLFFLVLRGYSAAAKRDQSLGRISLSHFGTLFVVSLFQPLAHLSLSTGSSPMSITPSAAATACVCVCVDFVEPCSISTARTTTVLPVIKRHQYPARHTLALTIMFTVVSLCCCCCIPDEKLPSYVACMRDTVCDT